MRRTVLIVLIVLCLWTPHVQAQGIPVFDAANLLQNVITAIQTTFTVLNQILDLTPVDEIVLSAEFVADLEALATMVDEAQGLAYDVGSLHAQVTSLFSLESAPTSAQGFRERMAEIRRVVFLSYAYALRTQTLIRTALSTVQHLNRLVSTIGSFIGNMQGNQTMSQVDSTLSKSLAILQVQTAAYERAQSVERIAEPMMIESLHRIQHEIMGDYPQ